jgi:hypothetical protein
MHFAREGRRSLGEGYQAYTRAVSGCRYKPAQERAIQKLRASGHFSQ